MWLWCQPKSFCSWLWDFGLWDFGLGLDNSLFWKRSRVFLQFISLLRDENNWKQGLVSRGNQSVPHSSISQLLQQYSGHPSLLCSYLQVLSITSAECKARLVVIRFRKRQDNKVGLSSSAKMVRRKQNLVSMQFDMISCLVETVSLFLVIFQEYEFLKHPLSPGQNSGKKSRSRS